MKISYFQNVTARNNVSVSLGEVFALIKDGHCQETVEKARKALKEGDKKDYDKTKSSLPCFTPSGVFENGHSKKDLKTYNSIVVLDIDKTGSERAEKLKQKASEMDITLAAFISPSGEGVKILVKTDSTKENHEQAFQQAAAHYENKLGIEVDKSGKDYSRLCFLSYDPGLYYNENSDTMKIEPVRKSDEYSTTSTTLDDVLFENAVSYTEKIKKYYPDNRNNHVYLLANNLNRIGVSQKEAEEKISAKYPDLVEGNEVKSSISSAYSHTAEHGVFTPDYINSVSSARLAKAANTKTENKSPYIPDEVYKSLPGFLKNGVDAFDVKRERDIFLTGALVILSGCFNPVKGIYDRREYHPNLNCFVIAPPASGKGVLNSARELAQKIHDKIEKAFNAENAKEEGDTSKLKRTHFIAADASSAAFKLNLKMNKEMGTICETEADTLSNTLQMEWGSYSDLIRKAFQHEPVTFTRLGKGDSIKTGEIKRPKLSMCLTGTPSQVPNLLQSTEDGLFSRIIFYTFKNDGEPFFKDVFAEEGIANLTEFFEKQAEKLYKWYRKTEEKGDITFKLEQNQKEQFLKHFDETVKKIYSEFGEETRSIVNRMGLIIFRIAMILSIIRKLEDDELANEIVCDGVDFNTSLLLSEVYLEHALKVYQTLPGSVLRDKNAESLFAFLPDKFTSAEAVKIGKTVANIHEKTVRNYLKKLKALGLLKQPKNYGKYFK